jgi:hypothetical protein
MPMVTIMMIDVDAGFTVTTTPDARRRTATTATMTIAIWR